MLPRARIAHKTSALIIAVLGSFCCQTAAADLQEDVEKVLAEEDLTGIAWTLIGEAGEVRDLLGVLGSGTATEAEVAGNVSFSRARSYELTRGVPPAEIAST